MSYPLKYRLIPLAMLVALLLSACASPTPAPAPTQPPAPTATADNSWTKVQQAGKLLVGTSADYAPFESYNDKYQIDGFDIALINEIAKQLGVTTQINDFAFDGLGGTLQLGQVDAVISAVSVTPGRQAVIDFSNIYYASDDAVLVQANSTLTPKTPDLLANNRLGVQQGSVYETYAKTQLIDTGKMPQRNLHVYQDITQAVNDLKAGRIQMVWMDLLPAQNFASDGSVKVAAQDLNQQLYAIAMPKGANALLNKINGALTTLQNNGTVARLAAQYLRSLSDQNIKPQPLPTPPPSAATPVPPRCIDGAAWVADLSFDDHNMTSPPVLQPGQPFTKGWRMRNSGTCTWTTGYRMAFSSGNVPAAQMGGQPIAVTQNVAPGGTFDFQVNLIAPLAPGTYQGFWNMRNDKNDKFGQTVWVGITVPGAPAWASARRAR